MEIPKEKRNLLVQKVIMSNMDNESKSEIVSILLDEDRKISIDLNKNLLDPSPSWTSQDCGKSITSC